MVKMNPQNIYCLNNKPCAKQISRISDKMNTKNGYSVHFCVFLCLHWMRLRADTAPYSPILCNSYFHYSLFIRVNECQPDATREKKDRKRTSRTKKTAKEGKQHRKKNIVKFLSDHKISLNNLWIDDSRARYAWSCGAQRNRNKRNRNRSKEFFPALARRRQNKQKKNWKRTKKNQAENNGTNWIINLFDLQWWKRNWCVNCDH